MNERLLQKHDVMISYSTKTKEIGDDTRDMFPCTSNVETLAKIVRKN